MDLALLAMKKLRKEGKLEDLEESEEINACSIVVPVEIDGVKEEWLVNFKNETHNHPTEIELCIPGDACDRCGRPDQAIK